MDRRDTALDTGLLDAGYNYLVIDDCWAELERDSEGRLVPSAEKFPNGMKAVADMHGRVSLQIQVKGEERLRLRAQLSLRGELASETVTPAQTGCNQLLLQVPEEKLRLWDVGQPNLYDLELCLEDGQGRVTDRVKSYLGLRSVELKQGAIWLNGRPLFQRLVLDQGFYPDGVYTAPSDAALKGDIELSMGLGFNGARLHQKIFEERFL